MFIMSGMRAWQQQWVSLVETACRWGSAKFHQWCIPSSWMVDGKFHLMEDWGYPYDETETPDVIPKTGTLRELKPTKTIENPLVLIVMDWIIPPFPTFSTSKDGGKFPGKRLHG